MYENDTAMLASLGPPIGGGGADVQIDDIYAAVARADDASVVGAQARAGARARERESARTQTPSRARACARTHTGTKAVCGRVLVLRRHASERPV